MQLRNVNYEFVEGEVQNIKENAEEQDAVITVRADAVNGAETDVFIQREEYDLIQEHPDEAVVQLRTTDAPLDECPDCGETFKDVALHVSKSECEVDENE